MNNNPLNLFSQIGHPKILVLGDIILDRYTWGNAERVSPEAPVLVLQVESHEVRLGGAASVAHLLRALEAEVTLAGVIGKDANGRVVSRLLDESGIDSQLVIEDINRPTTTKERFIGRSEGKHPHQVLRVDEESRNSLDSDQVRDLLNSLSAQIPQQAAVLISDYAKGVCTERLISEVIRLCHESKIPILVDPGRGIDFSVYRGASLIKPNRLEAELAAGRTIRSPETALQAAKQLQQQHEIEIVLITLDRDGLVYVSADESQHLPTSVQEICDITGAGDTVLSTLGLALSSPLSKLSNTTFRNIATLANTAAGLQVAKPGVTPISRTDLQRKVAQSSRSSVRESPDPASSPSVQASPDPAPRPSVRGSPDAAQQSASSVRGSPDPAQQPTEGLHNPNNSPKSQPAQATRITKLITLEEAKQLAEEYRRLGQTIVFTNGCFDLLHVGHVSMLTEAADQGDILFVAINSDTSVSRLKGSDRPIICEQDRARMLAAIECVDHVLIFEEDTPHCLLESIRPAILVKGGTTSRVVGTEAVELYGGKVFKTGTIPEISTTTLVNRCSKAVPHSLLETTSCG